jgi:predicted nucleotidyltransferase
MSHGGHSVSKRTSFEKELKSIVKQLAEFYHPEKVILFGSLLDGKAKPNDIDLFIIKKNPPRVGVDRIRELDRMIKYRFATDFIVYSPEEMEARINAGDPFVKAIMEKGSVLYEKQ